LNAHSGQPRGRRVFEVVCDAIRRDVADGVLIPGHKLPAEREFAERLGVSRAAVREALRALEASGVLEFRKGVHGGAFIRDASSTGVRASISDMLSVGNISLEHLSEVRSSLLTLAAKLACERATVKDLTLLEINIDLTTELEDGHDVTAMINAISDFYLLLGNASQNHILRILIEAVTDVARELLIKIQPPNSPKLSSIRRKILEAIRVRDAAEASRIMAQHMAVTHEYVARRGGDEILQGKAAVQPPQR
jgi:GntR family transcriptional regulator, transcriptional repressor for pyruvate dehydrogenase complex